MRTPLTIALFVFLIAGPSLANAATPPALVNYQGVLRDASDKPLSGPYDMLFRFMDAATGGNEIMLDQHAALTSNGITVTGGLFGVPLGSGTISDGSGPGTYTSLDAVFRDYGAVWLEIIVAGETLSPRTQIQSAAYSLNATNATNASQLNGQPASNFIDTSTTPQTKRGQVNLTINALNVRALDVENQNPTGGTGVFAVGASQGVFGFATYDHGSGVVGLAGGYASYGGYFDSQTGSYSFGVFGRGWEGGHFEQRDSTGGLSGVTADLAYSNTGMSAYSPNTGGIGVLATGEVDGVWAQATGTATAGATGGKFVASGALGIGVSGSGTTGGTFSSTATPGLSVRLADPGMGVNAVGGTVAGSFQTTVANSTGVSAYGAQTGVDGTGGAYGGLFHANSSGSTGVYASGDDTGVSATGQSRGGYFADSGVERATLAASGLGISGSGSSAGAYFSDGTPWFSYTYVPYQGDGIYAYGQGAGGEFHNFSSGSYAYVGYSSYKIQGSGSVSFVQNHPTDPSKVIVYAAPEGDEVAVYTRGSGRLVKGEAHIALGETFALVANPDIGLTATVTPTDELVPLMVARKSTRELLVRGPAGSDASFDYAVWGLRIGFEEQSIVQPKRNESKIPAMGQHEAFFASEPALRRYTALARFKGIEATVTGEKEFDFTGANALRNAVGVSEYHPPDEPVEASAPPERRAPEDSPAPAPLPSRPAASAAVSTAAVAPALTPTADVAPFPVNAVPVQVAESVEAGDVLANDPARPGDLRPSATAADPGVVGIVAGDTGARWSGTAPIALAGSIVLCKADASLDPIAPNDLLVASPNPGFAMRGGDNPKQGTVVGKALQSLERGTGTIRVLVMSR